MGDGAGAPRPKLICFLGELDDKDVLAEAKRRFAAYQADPSSLRPGLARGCARSGRVGRNRSVGRTRQASRAEEEDGACGRSQGATCWPGSTLGQAARFSAIGARYTLKHTAVGRTGAGPRGLVTAKRPRDISPRTRSNRRSGGRNERPRGPGRSGSRSSLAPALGLLFDALGAEFVAGKLVIANTPLLHAAFHNREQISAVSAARVSRTGPHGSLPWFAETFRRIVTGAACRRGAAAAVLAITLLRFERNPHLQA